MRSHLIRSLAVPCCAALLAGALPAVAGAQPKPALVQDIDEPGRNPYQQAMSFVASGSTCGNSFACSVDFPAVPAGKRLVLTYVSASFGTSANPASAGVTVGKSGDTTTFLTLPAVTVNPAVVGARFTASGPVTFYYEPGDVPSVTLGAQTMNFGSTNNVALVGYLIPLRERSAAHSHTQARRPGEDGEAARRA